MFKLFRFKNRERQVDKPEAIVWHDMLTDLPFLNFERAFIHKDYSAIVKSGTYTAEHDGEGMEAWFNIYSKYCEAINDKAAVAFISISVKILTLQAKIERFITIVDVLRNIRSKKLESILAAEFRGVDFTTDDPDKFSKSLDLAGSRVKSMVIRLNELIAERDISVPKGNQVITEQYFTDILMECSKIEGYRISKKDLSTDEFCSLFKRLMVEIERKKK